MSEEGKTSNRKDPWISNQMVDKEVKKENESPEWERDLITNLAMGALKEQRRTRRWGIFFKLFMVAYLVVFLVALIPATDGGLRAFHTATSITDPGNAQSVITVGSTHRRQPHTYGVSYFSSRGPTGDGRLKPDLVAPGEKIYAPICDGEFETLEGTSMAAPYVSGVAAMMLARFSEFIGDPVRVKQILCNSATDLGREPNYQGHGLVDALRALQSI